VVLLPSVLTPTSVAAVTAAALSDASASAAAAATAALRNNQQLCFLWKGARAPAKAMECAKAFLKRLRDLEGYPWAEVSREKMLPLRI